MRRIRREKRDRLSPCRIPRDGPTPWRMTRLNRRRPTPRRASPAGARPVKDRVRLFFAALRNPERGESDHHDSKGNIDEEGPSPRPMLDQPTSQYGPQSGGYGSESGPRADGSSTVFFVEGRADYCQAPGNEKRTPIPWIARATIS